MFTFIYLRNFFKLKIKQKVLKAKKLTTFNKKNLYNWMNLTKKEFIIRLFDQSGSGNKEQIISFENNIKLEKWINNNLLARLK